MQKNEPYQCLIIDDEPIAIEIIEEHLAQFSQFRICGKFTNALDATQMLNTEKVDLLFLDINMPGISGIDFIKTLNHPPYVIYTTAYREFAVDAFEQNALDYLVKPIAFERFVKAINRFLEQKLSIEQKNPNGFAGTETGFLTIQSEKKFHNLAHSQILFIASLDNYVKVYTTSGNYICYERLSALTKQLPANLFIRIHRSYIINKTKVNAFTSAYVEIDDHHLNIGRNYREDSLRRLTGNQ